MDWSMIQLRRAVVAGKYAEDRYSDNELPIYKRLLFVKWLILHGKMGEFC